MNKEVLLLFCLNLFTAMGYSLIAPLYPTLGKERNIDEDTLGWIIAIFPLFNFLITPFTPTLSNKYGRKQIFYFAMSLEGSCTICYGLLYWITNFYIFIIISMILRMFHGVGSGITATLVYSLTTTVSEESEVQTSLGYLEVAWSLGLALGPLMASFFYYLGGFPLPFFILGLILFTGVYVIYSLNLPLEKNESQSPDFFKSIINKDVFFNIFIVVVYLLSNTFYFPSLTNHLKDNWGLRVEIASAFFIINMAVYFIALQFLNQVTERLGNMMTMWVGLIMIAIGALFIYPVEFLPQILLSIILGLGLVGASGAAINVPSLLEMERAVKEEDDKIDEETANDIASAIYNFAVNIGDFSGPIFGGMISQKYGFCYSCIGMSILGLVATVIIGVVYFKVMYNDFIKKGKGKEDMGNRLINENGEKEKECSKEVNCNMEDINKRLKLIEMNKIIKDN